MNKKEQTIDTYNKTAERMAEKFIGLGARVADIEEVFALIQTPEPNVVEIGCGNGREAEEILKRTNRYLGMDISESMIQLAKQKAPRGMFVIADIESYDLPSDIDIIFAFASLLHVPKESLRRVLEDGMKALRPGGVFRISLKYADQYEESTREDEFGVRTYYLYSEDDIKSLNPGFEVIKMARNDLRGQEWLEVIFRKGN
jgi:SAM-dependent methyltransferase